MSPRYRRTRSTKADTLAATAISGVIGAAVAAVTFYMTRVFLSREPMMARAVSGEVAKEAAASLGSGEGSGAGGW
jgi:putative flippase GtrA